MIIYWCTNKNCMIIILFNNSNHWTAWSILRWILHLTFSIHKRFIFNTVFKWVRPPVMYSEGLGSNLSSQPRHILRFLVAFLKFLHENSMAVASIMQCLLTTTSVLTHYSPVILTLNIICSELPALSLNRLYIEIDNTWIWKMAVVISFTTPPDKSSEESHLANKYRSNTVAENCVSS